MLAFLEEAQIDRAGCFEYSDVEGATANQIEGQLPGSVKRERFERFMEKQAEISTARLATKVGSTIDVIVDHIDEEVITGRSKGDAPEVDGLVEVSQFRDNVCVGDVIQVEIEESGEYDLFGIQR